jgi:hypothetical protein
MCPACMAATAMLIASAVSSGGLTAVVVTKLRAKAMARKRTENRNPKEGPWQKQLASR